MSEWRQMSVQEIAAPTRYSLATGPFGSAISARFFTETGVPVIRGSNLSLDVGQRIIDDDLAFIPEELAERFTRSSARIGDLVFTCWGTVGQVGLIDNRSSYDRYIVSNKQMKLTANPKLADPLFLYYAFSEASFVERLQGIAIGSSVPGFNLGQLKNLTLRIPSLPIQQRVVAVLSALDDKIAVNNRVADTSLALAQACYDATAGPESWRSLPMGQSARWLSGGTPSTTESSYWDGDMPWISALSLKSPWIDDSERKVTRLGVEHGTRVVPRGTIIFVVRGSSLDTEFRIGLTQREVAFGQDCKALIAADGIDSVVLFLAIRSHSSEILNLVDHAGHGAGRLATDLITNVHVRLPDLSLEAEICRQMQYLVYLGARCQSENRTLREIRDSLLPKLMSGEIRVRDAERIVEDAT